MNIRISDFKWRGKLNMELAESFAYNASWHGDKRAKDAAASAKRAATALSNSMHDSRFLDYLKPAQKLALQAGADTMRELAKELAEVAAWAKAFHTFCVAERERQSAIEDEAFAIARWGTNDAEMIAEVEDALLFDSFDSSCNGSDIAAFVAQRHGISIGSIGKVYLRSGTAQPAELQVAFHAQPRDLKKIRRSASGFLKALLNNQGFRHNGDYFAGGEDFEAWRAWKKSVDTAVSAAVSAAMGRGSAPAPAKAVE